MRRRVETEEVFAWMMGVLFFGGLAGVAVFQMIFDDTGRKVGVGLLVAGAVFLVLWLISWAVARVMTAHRRRAAGVASVEPESTP